MANCILLFGLVRLLLPRLHNSTLALLGKVQRVASFNFIAVIGVIN